MCFFVRRMEFSTTHNGGLYSEVGGELSSSNENFILKGKVLGRGLGATYQYVLKKDRAFLFIELSLVSGFSKVIKRLFSSVYFIVR